MSSTIAPEIVKCVLCGKRYTRTDKRSMYCSKYCCQKSSRNRYTCLALSEEDMEAVGRIMLKTGIKTPVVAVRQAIYMAAKETQ